MKKLARVAAVSVMALSLTSGVAAAHSATVGVTGADSTNKVTFRDENKREVRNNTDLRVNNGNPQDARSGNVRNSRNTTTTGDAASGAVLNDSILETNVTIDSSAAGEAALAGGAAASHTGTVNDTGADSYNAIEFKDSSEVK